MSLPQDSDINRTNTPPSNQDLSTSLLEEPVDRIAVRVSLATVPGAVGNTPSLDSTGGNTDQIEVPPVPPVRISKRGLSKTTDIPPVIPKKSKSTTKPKGPSASGSSIGDSVTENVIGADDPGLLFDPAATNRNTTNPNLGKPLNVGIPLF
jgi:hypothetical protein